MRVNFRWLLSTICWLAACAPTPRSVPPLPQHDVASVLLPDSPRVVWRNDMGSGMIATLEARGPALFGTTTNRTVVALAQEDGRRFWLQRFEGAITTGAVVEGGRIYFATEDLRGAAHALDVARGRKVWSRRIGPTRLAPVLLDDRVHFATDAGVLFALRTADGAIAWQTELSAALVMQPVPYAGTLLTATAADSIYAISDADGSVLQRAHMPATPSAAPALLDSTLIVPLHNGAVIGLDARTLDLVFEVHLDAPVLAPVRVVDQSAYLLARNAVVWRISNGVAERLIELKGAARGSLAQIEDRLVAGLLDGRLIALDAQGKRLWEQQLPRSLIAPAVASGNGLYVAMINGEVWKLMK